MKTSITFIIFFFQISTSIIYALSISEITITILGTGDQYILNNKSL